MSDPALNLQTPGNENRDVFINLTKRTKRKLHDDSYEKSEMDRSELLTEISKLFTHSERTQSLKFDHLNTKMDDIIEQNLEIQKTICFFSEKYDELLERMDSAERENSALKTKICSLESKIDSLERNSRSAMLEINNLPSSSPESKDNLKECVCKIGAAIKCDIQLTEIQNIFRIKSKTNSSTNGTVVVEFNNITKKENMLQAIRQHNKLNMNSKLSTATIQLPGPPKPIFISESLTTYAKHLYYLARTLQKEGKCDSCWTYRGKIFIKKTPGSNPLCINTEQDLKNTVSSPK